MATRRRQSPRKQTDAKSRSSQPPAPRAPGDVASAAFPVVGIGASAGGLEALQELLGQVPSDGDMAFVVVSHQRTGHASLLPELLAKRTFMPVVEAADGARLQPNTVYLAPPDRDLAIDKGGFRLSEPRGEERPHLPIDHFFRSLAEEVGSDAVGIVLSGSGTDGTLGLKAIKGHAGMTMAQEVATARYAGMPQSAIASGAVDYVRGPAAMAEVLSTYVNRRRLIAEAPERESPQSWQRILQLLQGRTGTDFSVYKAGTMRRRLERRIHVNQLGGLDEYLRYLQANPHELDALFHELLIGVTNFFRDPDAFAVLKAKGLPLLPDGRPEGAVIRVWVAGCSTGEEAYSLAIGCAST